MRKTQYKTGFSLIELMIAIVASSIVILTVALILIMTFQSWRTNNAYADLRRDAALAVYLMARDIRESDMDDIIVVTNSLELLSHLPARNNTVIYTRTTGDALTSTDFGTIIPTNVKTFSAVRNIPGDGVYLKIGMANTKLNISITNEVFVNTRN